MKMFPADIWEYPIPKIGNFSFRFLGKTLDEIHNLTQDDVSLMMSHINSYKRKKLGNRSAYQLFSFLHDEGLLEKLGITLIPSKEINLTPLLLKK